MSEPVYVTTPLYNFLSTNLTTDGVGLTTSAIIPPLKQKSDPGYLTRDEFLHYSNILTWIKAIGQPISVFFLVLSALVFMKKGMRNSTTGLLVTLNLAEAYNVSLLSVYQICKLTDSCLNDKGYAIFLLYSSTFVGTACRRSVYIFNCLVAVQRFLVVAFPMKSKTWTILHSPKIISAAVLFLMLLVHAYIPVKYEVIAVGSLYRTSTSQTARDHADVFSAITTANICVTSYLPVMVGLFANIGMGTALYLHSQSMRNVSTSETQLKRGSKRSQTTTLVLTSTLLFFIFAIPSTMNQVVMETTSHYGPKAKEKYLFSTLSQGFVLCQIVSDMVVFFSYVTVGSAFRDHLVAMVLGPCRRTKALRNATCLKPPDHLIKDESTGSNGSTLARP